VSESGHEQDDPIQSLGPGPGLAQFSEAQYKGQSKYTADISSAFGTSGQAVVYWRTFN